MYIVGLIFAVLVCFGVPIGGSVWLIRRDKSLVKPILLGALTFTVTQLCLRLPLLQLVVQKTAWYSLMSATQPILTALFAGFTAALFEEGGRLLTMGLLMKKNRRFIDGLACGLGHGGWEALFLVGVGVAANVIVSPQIYTGELLILVGVERLLAMICHLGFSVMVMDTLKTKKIWGFVLALAAHTALDFSAGAMSAMGFGMWVIEGAAAAFTVMEIVYIIYMKRKYAK